MKTTSRVFALITAIILTFSLFPASASEEISVYIEDAYVYEFMRGEDGQFHTVTAKVVEAFSDGSIYGWSEFSLTLNGQSDTPSGTFSLADQQGEAPWEVGNTYPVTYNDEQTFNVEVLETPVTGIEWKDRYALFDEELGRFYYEPFALVSRIDGSITHSYNFLWDWLYPGNFGNDNYDCGYYVEVDFAYSREPETWTLGNTYEVTASFCGFTDTFTVTPVEIQGITVEPVELTEKLDGYIDDGYWEGDNYVEGPEWFKYYIQPETITVHHKDWESWTGSPDDYGALTDFWPEFTSDQSYENQWDVGEHTATVSLGGITADYTVKIVANPISHITVEPIELMEKVDGYFTSDGYYDENDNYVEGPQWFEYRIEPQTITVHYRDREPWTGSPYDYIELNGIWPEFISDQSYENQWGVGEHTATVSLGGVTADYPIKIIENPISHITVEPIEVIENLDGDFTSDGYWDEDGNYVEGPRWFEYYIYPEVITVHYKNGETLTGTYEYYEQFDEWPSCDTDQSYENQWGVGEHTATLSLGGIRTEFTVKVVENPILEVELLEKPDKTEYLAGEYFNLKGAVIRVKYKDGTHQDISVEEDYFSHYWREAYLEKLQRDSGIFLDDCLCTLGKESVTVGLFGMECTVPILVKENLTESVSIREAEDKSIVITVKNSDNTSTEMTLLSLTDFWNEEENYNNTALVTDKGIFDGYVFDENNTFAIGFGDGGALKSNLLSRCEWYEVAKLAQEYSYTIEACLSFEVILKNEHFSGKVTAENVDEIIQLAAELEISFDDREEWISDDGSWYFIYKGEDIRRAISEVFAIGALDLTLSARYDAEKDQYITSEFLGGGGGSNYCPDRLKYEDGVWDMTAVFPDYAEKRTVYLRLNSEGKIITYDINEPHSHIFENTCDTACDCGFTRTITHTYTNACDTECNVCKAKRTITHTYTNACDTECNVCKTKRSITHSYGEYQYNNDATYEKDGTKSRICKVCRDKQTVTASGTKLERPLKNSSTLFSDVPTNSWYKSYVDYAVTYGLLNGTGGGKMEPERTITRAEFVQVLANLSGIDTSKTNVSTIFADVKAGDWYAPAIKWANENGIVYGNSANTFAPESKITREEMCTMLIRFTEKTMKLTLKNVNAKKSFADDAQISSWAKESVYKCQKAGLVYGVSETEFAPAESADRAAVATIMTRFHQSYIK